MASFLLTSNREKNSQKGSRLLKKFLGLGRGIGMFAEDLEEGRGGG